MDIIFYVQISSRGARNIAKNPTFRLLPDQLGSMRRKVRGRAGKNQITSSDRSIPAQGHRGSGSGEGEVAISAADLFKAAPA
jgi:hypothetical protein